MRARAVLLSVLLLSLAAPAAAQNVKVFTTSWSKTDRPAPPGRQSEAASAAAALENFMDEAIAGKLPCAETLTQGDVGALIGHERQKALLTGNDSTEALAAIGGAIGARYVVSIGVIESQGSLTVSAKILDTVAGRTLTNQIDRFPLDGDAMDRLEAFAKKVAASEDGPKCPGPWKGTVSVTSSGETSGTASGGKKWTLRVDLTLNCDIDDRQARCTGHRVTSGESTAGPVSIVDDGAGSAVFNMTRQNGKVSVRLTVNQFRGTTTVTGPKGDKTTGTITMHFGSYSAEGPSSGQPNNESGSHSDGEGRTVSWSLSRK